MRICLFWKRFYFCVELSGFIYAGWVIIYRTYGYAEYAAEYAAGAAT